MQKGRYGTTVTIDAVLGEELIATRRLEVLEELRLPYRCSRDAEAAAGTPGSEDSAWASLRDPIGGGALYWFVGRGRPGSWSLASIPICGEIADERQVIALTERLGDTWHRDAEVLDASGSRASSIWRSERGDLVLPFDPDQLVANLRTERYRLLGRRASTRVLAPLRHTYYALQPLMSRRLQIALRRRFARVQAKARFPRWPVETALHDLVDYVLGCVADVAGRAVPFIAPWPKGRTWALVVTHDVETAKGVEGIERLLRVDQAAGLRSAWYLVPERYEVQDRLVASLEEHGCEVGVHGLRHDGHDLESLKTLRRRLPEIERWATRWGAVGFRAPALHRRWDWMPMLDFDYDSSYPDTDPYEPMPGGCCTWWPFFNRDMVELPITLAQDHTLFVILERGESVWLEKVAVLAARGGMALLDVHPDYILEGDRLGAYVRFLDFCRRDHTVWNALPREVAEWWRRRAGTSLCRADGEWVATGPAGGEAAIAFAHPSRLARSPSR